jgi:hypothetical protein
MQRPISTNTPPIQAIAEITGISVSQGGHDEKRDMFIELVLTEIPYAVLMATLIVFAIKCRPK